MFTHHVHVASKSLLWRKPLCKKNSVTPTWVNVVAHRTFWSQELTKHYDTSKHIECCGNCACEGRVQYIVTFQPNRGKVIFSVWIWSTQNDQSLRTFWFGLNTCVFWVLIECTRLLRSYLKVRVVYCQVMVWSWKQSSQAGYKLVTTCFFAFHVVVSCFEL